MLKDDFDCLVANPFQSELIGAPVTVTAVFRTNQRLM